MTVDKIQEALTRVQEATKEAADAENAARLADQERRAAFHRLNEAQKAFDDLVIEARKGAPRDSEWHRRQHPGVQLPG